MVLEHHLGSACEFQLICYKKKKKKEKEIRMMGGMNFISSLFRSKKDLTKEVKQRRMEKRSETTLGFQDEEGPCTSYQQNEDPELHRAPKKHTMAFSF